MPGRHGDWDLEEQNSLGTENGMSRRLWSGSGTSGKLFSERQEKHFDKSWTTGCGRKVSPHLQLMSRPVAGQNLKYASTEVQSMSTIIGQGTMYICLASSWPNFDLQSLTGGLFKYLPQGTAHGHVEAQNFTGGKHLQTDWELLSAFSASYPLLSGLPKDFLAKLSQQPAPGIIATVRAWSMEQLPCCPVLYLSQWLPGSTQ